MIDDSVYKVLIKKWSETGRVLTAIRQAELSSMRAEESRLAALDMLELASALPGDPQRERHSGLVEMQRLFSKLRASLRA